MLTSLYKKHVALLQQTHVRNCYTKVMLAFDVQNSSSHRLTRLTYELHYQTHDGIADPNSPLCTGCVMMTQLPSAQCNPVPAHVDWSINVHKYLSHEQRAGNRMCCLSPGGHIPIGCRPFRHSGEWSRRTSQTRLWEARPASMADLIGFTVNPTVGIQKMDAMFAVRRMVPTERQVSGQGPRRPLPHCATPCSSPPPHAQAL